MSNPKRKVTDLLPSEAILISSDADLKVLEEFEKVGIVWVNGGEKPTQWKHFPMSYCFLRYNEYGEEGLFWLHTKDCEEWGKTIYPATDFIQTESDEVEVDKFDLSKLTRYDLQVFGAGNAQMRKNSHGDYLLWSDIEQLLKTRNTPNQ